MDKELKFKGIEKKNQVDSGLPGKREGNKDGVMSCLLGPMKKLVAFHFVPPALYHHSSNIILTWTFRLVLNEGAVETFSGS